MQAPVVAAGVMGAAEEGGNGTGGEGEWPGPVEGY